MSFKKTAERIQDFLGLERGIVGVTLADKRPKKANISGVRYCEALLLAAAGDNLVFEGSLSLCPSSDVALGLSDPRYVDIRPRVNQRVRKILIAPLSDWDFREKPQIAIAFCDPSQAMQIAIALGGDISLVDGQIAVCGLTSYTFNEQLPSLSLLCNSCRLYAGVKQNELGMSFPADRLEKIWSNLKKIGQVTPKVRLDEHEITPSSRLLLQILKDMGRATQKELVRISGLSERSVRNSLHQLKRKNLVKEKPDMSDMRRKLYLLRA